MLDGIDTHNMKAVRITCRGKVQGVFFRASTRSKAQDLDLRGWVRNESNGDVSIHAQGLELAINDLIEWCQHGPELARVETVDVHVAEDEDLYSFEIRH